MATPQPNHVFFHLFGALPAELRLKIWSYNLPGPRLVPILCGAKDISFASHSRYPAPSSSGCTSTAPVPVNLHVCHESRSEALKSRKRKQSSLCGDVDGGSGSSSSSVSEGGAKRSRTWAPGCAGPERDEQGSRERKGKGKGQGEWAGDEEQQRVGSYALSFGIARQPGQIFFDFERDVLYFGARDGYMASEAQFRTVLSLVSPGELARVRRVAINEALFWVDASCYMSMVAASLTAEVLALVRTRLPALRELLFVPRDENPVYAPDACLVEPGPVSGYGAGGGGGGGAECTRMERQVQTAVRTVREQFPDWEPPRWKVVVLAAGPERWGARCLAEGVVTAVGGPGA